MFWESLFWNAAIGAATDSREPSPLVRRLGFPEPSPLGTIALERNVPFLENFLVDAEQFWATHSSGHLKSGPWTEVSRGNQDYNLEATALSVGDLKVLLIDSLGLAYEERQSFLQKARGTSLDYQRLLQETQSKEILLHCIVHDLRGPLTGIRACLDLLGREPLAERAQPRLDTAIEASSKLEGLVGDILTSLCRSGLSGQVWTRDPLVERKFTDCQVSCFGVM